MFMRPATELAGGGVAKVQKSKVSEYVLFLNALHEPLLQDARHCLPQASEHFACIVEKRLPAQAYPKTCNVTGLSAARRL